MLPIIYVHDLNREYLPVTLWKARVSNPRADVILLGTWQNAHWHGLARHYAIRSYSVAAATFAKTFRNFGPNRDDFALACIRRWFVLEEFLRAHHIDRCLHTDADVLLYGDVEADAERFSAFGMTKNGNSGHTNFISGIDDLSAFCESIRAWYQDVASVTRLAERFHALPLAEAPDGISDMTFLSDYATAHPTRVLDISAPIEGSMYDESLGTTSGLATDGHMKKLRWIGEKPFAESVRGELIEMRSLHFQGATKRFMKPMSHLHSRAFDIAHLLNRPYVLAQRTWNRFARTVSPSSPR